MEYMRPLQLGARGLGGLKGEGNATPDEQIDATWMLENLWIVGDSDEVARKIRRLYHDVGGFGTLLIICHDMPTGLWERSLTLLGRDVMPQLRDLTGEERLPESATRP